MPWGDLQIKLAPKTTPSALTQRRKRGYPDPTNQQTMLTALTYSARNVRYNS